MKVLVEECDVALIAYRLELAQLVDGIGTEQFGSCMMNFLHEVCGADHCVAFQLGAESSHALLITSLDRSQPSTTYAERYAREGLWLKDPAIPVLQRQLDTVTTGLIHVDINDTAYADIWPQIFPQVGDRVLVCGRRENMDFGLSVARTDPNTSFDADGIQHLANVSNVLVSSLIKHVSVLMHRPNVATALTNLPEIEKCVIARSKLPRREIEVCARILYGLSSVGISLDLGIGEESVKTYRKRAYQRLGIGSERELLHWYLSQWSAWPGHVNMGIQGRSH